MEEELLRLKYKLAGDDLPFFVVVVLRFIETIDFSLNSKMCQPGAEPIMFSAQTTDVEIPFTYSVKFKRNDAIRWASRWDYILKSLPQTSIQWFSIINSLIIVLFLSGMIAMIFIRTLYKDITRYNQIDTFSEVCKRN